MFILPHFLAYGKYYFCPGDSGTNLGSAQLTKKYFIGGICGRYYNDSLRLYSALGAIHDTGSRTIKMIFRITEEWQVWSVCAIILVFMLEWTQITNYEKKLAAKIERETPIATLLNTPYSIENPYHCTALNIYWEARNQSFVGQLAVAHVVNNRINSPHFPNDVCSVVTQGSRSSGEVKLNQCQFSWYCDGSDDYPEDFRSYAKAFEFALFFLGEKTTDITEGATHYHSKKVSPDWASTLEKIAGIDQHIFYREGVVK